MITIGKLSPLRYERVMIVKILSTGIAIGGIVTTEVNARGIR